jgi:hypothetical protein
MIYQPTPMRPEPSGHVAPGFLSCIAHYVDKRIRMHRVDKAALDFPVLV